MPDDNEITRQDAMRPQAHGLPQGNQIIWNEANRKKCKITFVAIAKDEEEALPRIIPSLEGFADRIVIVETKNSTDNTVQVAKDLGAEVIQMDWPKPTDYGEARNMAVRHAMSKCMTKKSQGDWIAMFDVDEILINGPKVRAALEQCPEQVHLASLEHWTAAGHKFPRACMFRPGKGKYHYRVHEHLLREDNSGGVLHIPPDIGYLEHPDAIGATHDHNELLECMKLDSEKYTDNGTRHYYYGRQLYYKGDFECVPVLEKACEHSGWAEEKCLAMCFVGQLYAQHDQKEKAFEYYKKAMQHSDKVRDPYWGLLGFMNPQSKEAWELAKKALSIERSIYFDSNPHLYNEENTNKLRNLIHNYEVNHNDSLGRKMRIDPRQLVPPVRY